MVFGVFGEPRNSAKPSFFILVSSAMEAREISTQYLSVVPLVLMSTAIVGNVTHSLLPIFPDPQNKTIGGKT